jgi:ribosomal protein S18 acetylase RimI-like enzyme
MTVLVRKLKVSDLPRLEQIEADELTRTPRAGWLATFRRMVEAALEHEPSGLLIAEDARKVVGWAYARQRGPHPVSGVPYGHIFHVSVAHSHRRKGTGQRLFRECEAYLRSRGCKSVHLSMRAGDQRPVDWLERFGYQVAAWELEREFD